MGLSEVNTNSLVQRYKTHSLLQFISFDLGRRHLRARSGDRVRPTNGDVVCSDVVDGEMYVPFLERLLEFLLGDDRRYGWWLGQPSDVILQKLVRSLETLPRVKAAGLELVILEPTTRVMTNRKRAKRTQL